MSVMKTCEFSSFRPEVWLYSILHIYSQSQKLMQRLFTNQLLMWHLQPLEGDKNQEPAASVCLSVCILAPFCVLCFANLNAALSMFVCCSLCLCLLLSSVSLQQIFKKAIKLKKWSNSPSRLAHPAEWNKLLSLNCSCRLTWVSSLSAFLFFLLSVLDFLCFPLHTSSSSSSSSLLYNHSPSVLPLPASLPSFPFCVYPFLFFSCRSLSLGWRWCSSPGCYSSGCARLYPLLVDIRYCISPF